MTSSGTSSPAPEAVAPPRARRYRPKLRPARTIWTGRLNAANVIDIPPRDSLDARRRRNAPVQSGRLDAVERLVRRTTPGKIRVPQDVAGETVNAEQGHPLPLCLQRADRCAFHRSRSRQQCCQFRTVGACSRALRLSRRPVLLSRRIINLTASSESPPIAKKSSSSPIASNSSRWRQIAKTSACTSSSTLPVLMARSDGAWPGAGNEARAILPLAVVGSARTNDRVFGTM